MAGTAGGTIVAAGAVGIGGLIAWIFYKKKSTQSSGTSGGTATSSAPNYYPPNYPNAAQSPASASGSLGLGGGAGSVPSSSGIFGTPLAAAVNQGNYDLAANTNSDQLWTSSDLSKYGETENSTSLDAQAAGYNDGSSWFSNFLTSIGGGWALPAASSSMPDGSIDSAQVADLLTGGGMFSDGNDGLDMDLSGGGDIGDISGVSNPPDGGNVNDYGGGDNGSTGDDGDNNDDGGGDNGSSEDGMDGGDGNDDDD